MVIETINKMTHYDPDERYMATSDLINILLNKSEKDNKTNILDKHHQVKVRDNILEQIIDENGDVQTISAKFLSKCTHLFTNEHILYIISKLSQLMIQSIHNKNISKEAQNKEIRRNISIGDAIKAILRSNVFKFTPEVSDILLRSILKRLQSSNKNESTDVEMQCLDILHLIIKLYGNDIRNTSKGDVITAILNTLKSLIKHNDEYIQLRTIDIYAEIVSILNEDEFKNLLNYLFKLTDQQIYIHTIAHICIKASNRIITFNLTTNIIEKLIYMCTSYLDHDNINELDEKNVDLIVYIIFALSELMKYSNIVQSYYNQVVEIATQLLKYDPLYTYDDDDDDDAMDLTIETAHNNEEEYDGTNNNAEKIIGI